MTTRFLALCFLGSGSVHGQSETYPKAVEIAFREAKGFAKTFGGFSKKAEPLPFNVYDYDPWDSILWSDNMVWGRNKGNDSAHSITAIRHVWIDPITGKTVKDLTHDEWLAEDAAAKAGTTAS